MNVDKVEESIQRHVEELLEEKGYVSPLDLLLKMDRVTQKQIEDWRFKRIPYLEQVINGNQKKMNVILKTLKKVAADFQLKPSLTVYKTWGKGPKKTLMFSRKAKPIIEKQYATHYVQSKKN